MNAKTAWQSSLDGSWSYMLKAKIYTCHKTNVMQAARVPLKRE